MSKLRFFLVMGFIVSFTACGSKSDDAFDSPSDVPSNPAPAGWTTEHHESPDGGVTLDRTHATPEQIAEARNQYKRANLIQLPVDSKYNANVLRISDTSIEDYRNKAFIAPKLYCYGTQQGGKLAPIHHANGTITLAFNVTFLDGSTKRILAPSDDGSSVDLPDLFSVQYPEELKEVLRTQYGADNGLAALPGCPKKLTLVAAGKEYDATPSDLARGDFCQLNVPVTVSLTLPEKEAEMIMDVELYAHTVDLRAVYETKVSYPTSNITIRFDRSKLYNELKGEIGGKFWIAEADARAALTKVVEHQLMQIVVQGEISDFAGHLVDKISNELFETWEKDPATAATPPCGSSKLCVRISDSTLAQSSMMEFTWAQETNLLSGQNYITSTKLKATPSTVEIGNSKSCTGLEFGDCNRLTNDGIPRETGLTVVSGNKVTIDPELIIKETRNNTNPETTRENHKVCVNRELVCQRYFGQKICTEVCNYQNEWVDTTHYTTGSSTPQILNMAVGQMQELFDGLYLQFRWIDHLTGARVTEECPLSQFPREGNGKALTVRLENTRGCNPFTGVAGETPMLYLVNKISFTEKYKTGDEVVLWNGRVLSHPDTYEFKPKVDFAGSLSIQGYGIESESSRGTVE